MNPDPYTFRELLWMADGKIEHQDRLLWNHTACILAMQINTMPFRKQGAKAVGPAEFNPYAKKKEADPPQMDKAAFKRLWVGAG